MPDTVIDSVGTFIAEMTKLQQISDELRTVFWFRGHAKVCWKLLPGDLRRELARLQEAVNTQHVHPRLGGQDAGAAPSGPAAAEAAHELRGADGAAATDSGARDFHPAGECGWDGHGAEPIVPGGEEASGAVPAVGGEHRARGADGVSERARAEALAPQAAERLTDT